MRVAHLSYSEALARRRASQIASGLLLFVLTTVAGLAAPGVKTAGGELQFAESIDATEIKGVAPFLNAGENRPSAAGPVAASLTPLFNLDPRLPREVEPNATPATANALTLSAGGFTRISGNVFANGDVDYFSFTGTAGDRIYAAVMTSASANANANANIDSQLRLFASDGTTLVEFDDDDGSFGGFSSSIAGATLTATGIYYFQVNHFSATNQLRPYDLYVQRRTGTPTAEVEPNDTPATANVLAGGWARGARDPALAAEQDWFSFTANAGDTVFLSLDLDPERDNVQWNGRLGIGLFGDVDNQILTANDVSTGSVANPLSEAMFITVKNTGTYFAFVDSSTAATGGPTATYNLSVSVLPSPNAGCTTYTSTDVPLVIPAGPGNLVSTLTIPGNPRIADLNVSVQLNHTRMADLDVSLISPSGNNVGLFTDIGNGTPGPTAQAQMDTTFDDEAGITPLFTVLRGVNYRPEFAYQLNWFDGQNAGGVWTLDIRDDLAAEAGNLTGWSMTVCEAPPPPSCAVGQVATTVYSNDFEANNGGFTSSGTLNEWEYGLPTLAPINSCNSGSNCWKTDLDGVYEFSSNQTLLSPNINLAGLSAPVVIRWAQKYQLESAQFDPYNVTAQQVGGATPTRLFEWLGATMTNIVGNPAVTINESAGWGLFSARADNLAGFNSELVFNLVGDVSGSFAGVGIDDVSVTACRNLSADLSITKTNGTASSVPGGSSVYTITASNAAGGDTVTGATVADTFPASLTCTWTCAGAGGGSCTTANGSGNINATVNLPALGSATFTATCAIAGSATGTLINTASVSSSVTDPTPGNNSATDTDTLVASANLIAALTDTPDPVTAGANLTYNASITNAGPSDAQTVTAGLPLPAGTTFVSATPSGTGTCTNPGVGVNGAVNCTWAGASNTSTPRTVSVVAAVGIATMGPLSATLTAGSATTDPTPGNNTASATTAVAPPSADLSLTLSDNPDPVTAGTTLTYTATTTNNGPGIAQNVAITVQLQVGSTAATPTPSSGGTCNVIDVGGQMTVNCTWAGPTANGAVRSVLVTAAVPASATAGNLVANASTTATTMDGTPGNNTATANTAVTTSADLVLTFAASPAQATPGLAITYAASVTNSGPSDAQNVQLSVVLGPGVQFSSATPSAGGTCSAPSFGANGTVTCTWNGATAVAVIRSVSVVAYSYIRGNASANATASSATSDPTPANTASGSVINGTVGAPNAILIPATDHAVLALMAMLLGLLGFAAVRRRL